MGASGPASLHNDPWVQDYRCQFVGVHYRLLVTYA